MKRIGSAVALTTLMSALTLAAPAAALVTIGANVTDTSNTSAIGCVPDCTFMAGADDPPQPMQAPCAGTVTKWRVNVGASDVVFRLRVIRNNGDGTYTSTASSAAQTNFFSSGVVAFPTSVPIAAGEFLGVDLTAGGVILARNFTIGDVSFSPPMADGTPQAPGFTAEFDALVNADIACASAPAGPTGPGPTGERAAALKKCKKMKKSKAKRKRCKKKANALPV